MKIMNRSTAIRWGVVTVGAVVWFLYPCLQSRFLGNSLATLENSSRSKIGRIHSTEVTKAIKVSETPLIPQSLLAQVLPRLKEYEDVQKKVLRTTDEKDLLNRMLADPERIRQATLLLDEVVVDHATLESHEIARLKALDFLESGLRWKENPARQDIIDRLYALLVHDNLPPKEKENGLRAARSYAGDKVEIYATLNEHSPETLEPLRDLPEDGRIRRLMQFAEKQIRTVRSQKNNS